MEPKKGDILQHVGFKPSGHWLRPARMKLAEVMNVRERDIMLHVNEEPEAKYIKKFEVLRWWEVMPQIGTIPPSWVKKGAVFRPRQEQVLNRAVIHSVSPGWVSLFDHMKIAGVSQNVFRVIAYDTFEVNWQPDESPSIWDRILNDDAPV